jgi:hypothetical protein
VRSTIRILPANATAYALFALVSPSAYSQEAFTPQIHGVVMFRRPLWGRCWITSSGFSGSSRTTACVPSIDRPLNARSSRVHTCSRPSLAQTQWVERSARMSLSKVGDPDDAKSKNPA